MVANKLIYECTIVENADFFKSPFGNPDIRDKVLAIINCDYKLKYELANKVAQSNGMDVTYWLDKINCWIPRYQKRYYKDGLPVVIDRGLNDDLRYKAYSLFKVDVDPIEETMSKVEMALVLESKRAVFLESYRCFGLGEYCRIIKLFLDRDCLKAARLYTHLCFKNGDSCLNVASRNELMQLVNLESRISSFLKECDCDMVVKLLVERAGYDGLDGCP